MKIFTKITALLLILMLLPLSVLGKELIPVGQVVGLELQDDCVSVAGVDKEMGAKTKADGLVSGDRILAIDGRAIKNAEDVRTALQRSKGTVTIAIQRDGKNRELSVTPEITSDGPKLGIYLRQGVTGIGTVTYYDPDTGNFGTLGHGVSNSKGQLLQLTNGNAYSARVLAVRKGVSGEPGQLMGSIESKTPIGTLTQNTQQGVFGTSRTGWEGEAIQVANADEIRTGSATIRSTVSGNIVREYSVEILKIYPKSRSNCRNLLLKITDQTLLSTTGGIVQGMGVSYNRDNQVNP